MGEGGVISSSGFDVNALCFQVILIEVVEDIVIKASHYWR